MPSVTAKRYWRRREAGRYTEAVTPNTWQQNLESLLRGLAAAQEAGNTYLVGRCEAAIERHRALDPAAYNRSLGLE